jgi:hypothetical protein
MSGYEGRLEALAAVNTARMTQNGHWVATKSEDTDRMCGFRRPMFYIDGGPIP